MNKEEQSRKKLQDLTIRDNFMFAAVMMDEENAKGVLERALGMKIAKVHVSYEKSIVYHPEYKGIRLDVYVKDDKESYFNVEMQVANREIMKRSRYYHSQIDMELLESGVDYENLPKAYVIFICDFDPFGLKKYRYTRTQSFAEDKSYVYDDNSYTVFLSTKGQNEDEVPKDLVNFLTYVDDKNLSTKKAYEDAFVNRLQKSVNKIKLDREMGRRYMLFEEIKKEEYRAGLAKGLAKGREEGRMIQINTIIDFLSETAPVPENLKGRISKVESLEALQQLIKVAAKVSSIDEFEKTLSEMKL